MANPQTAEEWRQAAAAAEASLPDAIAEKSQADAAYQAGLTTKNELQSKFSVSYYQANFPGFNSSDPNSPGYNEWKAARAAYYDFTNNTLPDLQNAAQIAAGKVSNLERTIRVSNENAAIAETGPPGTSTNTPPAGASTNANSTGPSTAVTSPVADPVSDQKTIVNPNDDTSADTADQADPDTAGSQNQEWPTSQDVIDAEDDPYVRAQMELAQSESDPPTEQDVLEAMGKQGLTSDLSDARSNATKKDAVNFNQQKDWRVRISLAPGAKYLYKGIPKAEAGILAPLQDTDGVIFPYTPSINVSYVAGYDPSELIHSNYKVYQYKGSSVDSVQISGQFTAQDSVEANYLLAVIHFFRSVTKMFYGQDQNPNNGVPPPLCYLHGLGAYQFDHHPLVVTNFTYSLPDDVDYIRAGSITNNPGQTTAGQTTTSSASDASNARLAAAGLGPRGPNFQNKQWTINNDATYVPTKMQIAITCIPIVSRNDISNRFSLKKYATGALLRGSKNNSGGIW